MDLTAIFTPQVVATILTLGGAVVGWFLRHYGVGMGGSASTPASHPVLDLLLQKLDAKSRAGLEAQVDAVLNQLLQDPTVTANHPLIGQFSK